MSDIKKPDIKKLKSQLDRGLITMDFNYAILWLCEKILKMEEMNE